MLAGVGQNSTKEQERPLALPALALKLVNLVPPCISLLLFKLLPCAGAQSE